jgi:hypothetical protein
MEESFGKIVTDPCWHPASAVRPVHSFDILRGEDGLLEDWFGNIAFVNPPWSAQDDWVRRTHDQWARGNVRKVLCLVPAATSAAVFHEVLSAEADVFFLRGRPRFSKVDGTSEGTMHNTMLIAFGATLADKIRFKARVRGSWWRPDALSTLPVDTSPPGAVVGFWRVDPLSCVAGESRGVVCGPLPALGVR